MGRCRHSWVNLSVCVAIGGAVMAETASAQVTPLEQAQFLSWTGLRDQKTVRDGSVLTEYQGTTEAINRPGMLLKVSFSPRFSCSPTIALMVPDDDGAGPGTVAESSSSETSQIGAVAERSEVAVDTGEIPAFADDQRLDFQIDSTNVDFPLIVDSDEGVVWTFNGGGRERETLRLQIDTGDVAMVTVAEDRKISFSLLGSRKTLESLQTLCREHEPIPLDN